MRKIGLTRPIRVGILAVASTDELLSNVGPAAWEASGALAIEHELAANAFAVVRRLVVHGGKQHEVERLLKDWGDAPNAAARCDVILTVGGDGLGLRDVMPDAVRAVAQSENPELAAKLLHDDDPPLGAATKIPAALTRATVGAREKCLLVNIPSVYAKPAQAVRVLLPLLPEALLTIGVDAFQVAKGRRARGKNGS